MTLGLQKSTRSLAGMLVLLTTAPVLAFALNKSIEIGDNASSDGHSTVNGRISVGRKAIVNGTLETVNGTIRVDDDSQVEKVSTVNGSIRLGAGVMAQDVSSVNGSISLDEHVSVDGSVSIVNGRISIDSGSHINDDVSNVNGEISIEDSQLDGDLSTVTGDITFGPKSTLKGDLIVHEPHSWGDRHRRKPKIVIGPGSVIDGKIELEYVVELYISDSATVGDVSGEMSLADAVRFSGERP